MVIHRLKPCRYRVSYGFLEPDYSDRPTPDFLTLSNRYARILAAKDELHLLM